MCRASFSSCSRRSGMPGKRYCSSFFKQLMVAWPSVRPLEVSDTTPRRACKTLHFFGCYWSPTFSIPVFAIFSTLFSFPSDAANNLRSSTKRRLVTLDAIDFESLYSSAELNFHATRLIHKVNRRGHSASPCGRLLLKRMDDFTVRAAIFVFQLSDSSPTTSQIYFGNLWSHMIFFNQSWSTQSYALRTSIHATMRLRLFRWQSKVTIRSIMRLSVVPLHLAFATLWLFSISSCLSTCSSIGPKTHEVNTCMMCWGTW